MSVIAEQMLLEEEAAGERRANRVRLLLAPSLGLLLGAQCLQQGAVRLPELVSFLALGVFFLYSGVMVFGLRAGRYRGAFKYVSVVLELLLVAATLAAFQFDSPAGDARLFSAGQGLVFFLSIALSGLRYSFRLSVTAGALAGLLYALAVLPDLPGLFRGDLSGGFFSPLFASHAILNEVAKSAILFAAGLTTGIVSRNARALLERSTRTEDEAGIIQARHRLAAQAEREAKMYLANVSEGLLSFGRNYMIKEQYSAAVRTILGARRVDGMRFADFILADPADPRREALMDFLDLAFNNTTADFDMIADVNPLAEMEFVRSDGETRQLAISFKRVLDDDGKIVELMAMINDVTELVLSRRRLDQEQRRHQDDMEMIAAILRSDLEDFEVFSEEGRTALERIGTLLEALPTLAADEVSDAINAAFRDAHTLKGNARNYGFAMIAEKAHRAEDLLAGLRDDGAEAVAAGLPECRTRFAELKAAFEQLTGLGRKFASFSQSRAFSPDVPESPLVRFHRHFEVLVNQLAQALNKEIGFELVNSLTSEVPVALLDAIRDPLGHLLRNAADHAIELPDEREAAGKTRCGLLRITLAHRDRFFVIGMRDDGKGIAYETILARAVEKGLVPAGKQPDRRALLGLLFHPGFSTREAASDYSGRGVGLDAVRAQVKRLGGRIEVRTSAGMGTEFSLLIPETIGVAGA